MEEFLFKSELLGNIYIIDILLYYIYPRCFVCKNEKHQKYMFYEVSSNDKTDIWVVCGLEDSDLECIKNKKCSIQDIYKRYECIEVTYDHKTCSSTYILSDNVISMLPKVDVFYDPEM